MIWFTVIIVRLAWALGWWCGQMILVMAHLTVLLVRLLRLAWDKYHD